jgi:hypothetical protein
MRGVDFFHPNPFLNPDSKSKPALIGSLGGLLLSRTSKENLELTKRRL